MGGRGAVAIVLKIDNFGTTGDTYVEVDNGSTLVVALGPGVGSPLK